MPTVQDVLDTISRLDSNDRVAFKIVTIPDIWWEIHEEITYNKDYEWYNENDMNDDAQSIMNAVEQYDDLGRENVRYLVREYLEEKEKNKEEE